MAGIGFELRRLIKSERLSAKFLSFIYSAFLSAGPWIISIIAIIVAGILASEVSKNGEFIRKCQVVITYITALSLIISSPLQLTFSRYVADRIFNKEIDRILPNLIGAITVMIVSGFTAGIIIGILNLKELSIPFILLFSFSLALFSAFWIVATVLTSLKSYKFILFSFFLGFSLTVILSMYLAKQMLLGFLLAYFLGAGITFSLLLSYIFKFFPSNRLIEFDFLNKKRVFYSLALVGLFYNLGIWIDKFLFWFSPTTGKSVLGPFHASVVYDIPMFLAYLSIAPGMGIFFLRLEGEFAEYYHRYYEAVREGETLERIFELGYEMIMAARSLIQEVLRVQILTLVIIFLTETILFGIFKLSLLYIPLFNILCLGTSLQLLFMVVISLLFYFDLRKETVVATAVFLITNALLSYLSIKAGPYFYGYGFAFSLLISFIASILLIRRILYEIHYRTFMLNT
ncbi:exopolysaccharide Pel transporter PelG [Thermovibrio sp.]